MIELAYPAALLALVAIPVLLALHLLRPRRRRVLVSTTRVWEAALRDREGGQGLRRLLRNLSLLLLLAAALVLGLALAGPQWLLPAAADSDVVLVLDTSASMQTRTGLASTRFDAALAQAERIVGALPRNGRLLVMTSARKAVLRTGFESDRAALRRTLARLRPGDEAGRPAEALALALSLTRGRPDARIHFVTDGAFDADVDTPSPQVEFHLVGAPARNIAITGFELRPERASEERYQMLLTVRNYTDAPVNVPASASLEGRELFRRTFELPAHGARSLVLAFPGRALGQAVARIEVDDDLAADNQAYAALGAPQALRVLLLSRGNIYLESALEASPDTELARHDGPLTEDLAALARRFDVVVFDRVEAPPLPAGNFLLIDTLAPGLPFSAAGEVAQPRIAGRGPSPLMRDVDLTAVRIEKARRIVTGPRASGLQRLFWSAETDLAYALVDPQRKLVYLGFDLAGSNFPLQAAFPLFLSQSLEWLRPRDDGRVGNHIAAGSAHAIAVPAGEQQVTVYAPSGEAHTLAAKDGVASFDATAAAGFYRYGTDEAARHFAVSLADARESDVSPRFAPAGRRESAAAAGSARALAPLWPYLLALALVLLALEWWVWTRSAGRA